MNRLNLSKYTQKDRVKREIQETIKVYTDLVPKMEFYTFNDGVQRNLASLSGTIKVYYVTQVYNIPICLYLTEAHPYQAPVVYVRPTANMQIKQNKSVDTQGKVYLPYLSDWDANKSDLQSLLSILQIEFSEQMPVFAKSAASPSYPPAAQNQYYAGGGYQPYPQQQQPAQQPGTHGIGSGWGSPGTATSAYPPAYPPPATTQPPYMPGTVNTGAYYPPPATNQPPYMPGMKAVAANGRDSCSAINDDVVKMSMLSAVEDKLRRVQKDLYAQQAAELEVLETTNRELRKGGETLQRMLADMDHEKTQIDRARRELEEDNEALLANLSVCAREDDAGINYDEVVEGSAPLYRQLVGLYVEEQSLEDVFYFLGDAVGRGVLDIDSFLKKVRELSRRQFMLRATIKKCREKAGLPDV